MIRFDFNGGYYNLTNDISQSLNKVIAGYEYYFFIQAERYSTANITLIMDKKSNKPISFLDIYEYKALSSDELSFITKKTESVSFVIKEYESIASHLYTVSSYASKILAFSINSNQNLTDLLVNVKIEGGSFYLNNNITKRINSLKSGNSYYFFINGTKGKIANIDLNMNYIKESPFNNLDILEYRNLEENNYERVSTIDVNTKKKKVN